MYGGEDWVEYEIIWDVGPLGFTLGLNEGSGFPVVSRLTAESAATAVGVRPGHELIGLNGGSTKEYGFDNTVVILKAIAKPGRCLSVFFHLLVFFWLLCISSLGCSSI